MSLIKQFGIQLYSLRKEADESGLPGVLATVSNAGYRAVEFAGYGGLEAGEMLSLLQKHSLTPVGTHSGIKKLTEELDDELAYSSAIGTQNIILPYYPLENAEDVRKLAGILKEIAPKVRAAGFGFGYHNHAHEFATDNGRYLLDILLESLPADELFLELDIFWAAYAGVDYMAYMQKHAGRIKMLHLKQIDNFEAKQCVDLDEGVIDFKAVIELGNRIGVEHYILEQEKFAVSAGQSIIKGFNHIMSL